MNAQPLVLDAPAIPVATGPAEARGLARDEVRLLVSSRAGHVHGRFHELPRFLEPGSLVVVNRSATLPASLPAEAAKLAFTLNLSTRYGPGLWLAEPRWAPGRPGPLPLDAGDVIEAAGVPARLIARYPGLPRLWFVRFSGDIDTAMARHGEPIRYAYIEPPYPDLGAYQTIFAKAPGSAEMPSAARPFTQRTLHDLARRDIGVFEIELHTGVSSLEVEREDQPLYAEPFVVPPATAQAIGAARRQRRPVIAVGTTVVRALESAWDGTSIQAVRGFTRRHIRSNSTVNAVDGLITGFHEPKASHISMLNAIAGRSLVSEAYAEALRGNYLWHEFGDSHLLLAQRR
ncbi:MAG: S-adenosylmethionine:tRNA ribosyltransferase-isomerase [Methylobacteriaceae bacterium]|nr:S-adenosylmethionine:tRNA ribosyltransferase-isomerase [Methylobacteriaceae bacterium]